MGIIQNKVSRVTTSSLELGIILSTSGFKLTEATQKLMGVKGGDIINFGTDGKKVYINKSTEKDPSGKLVGNVLGANGSVSGLKGLISAILENQNLDKDFISSANKIYLDIAETPETVTSEDGTETLYFELIVKTVHTATQEEKDKITKIVTARSKDKTKKTDSKSEQLSQSQDSAKGAVKAAIPTKAPLGDI